MHSRSSQQQQVGDAILLWSLLRPSRLQGNIHLLLMHIAYCCSHDSSGITSSTLNGSKDVMLTIEPW
jgi:hypothetical protein